jgi:hypothetical protein
MSEQAGQGFDRSEPNVRFVAIFGAGTLVLLVVAVLALQFYYDRVLEEQVFVKVQEPVAQSLVDLRAREDEALHSYRYLDREKGTVRLPIERAMELLAEEAAQGKLRYPQRPVPVEIQGGANVAK